MKKVNLLLTITLGALLAACSGSKNENNTADSTAVLKDSIAPLPTLLSLEKTWETDTTSLITPESVIYDSSAKVLYVSCINGVPPDKKDNDGYIAKVGLDGKVIEAKWIKGFSAPKGMGIYNNKLYVTDIDQVVEIDLSKGKIAKKYPVKKAKFLNDIDVKANGDIFISDSYGDAIYLLSNGKIDLWLQNDSLGKPNGLMAREDALYMSTFGSNEFVKFDYTTKAKTLLSKGVTEGDGVVLYNDSTFLVSGWSGYYFQYTPSGKAKEILNTVDAKSHAADFWYIKDKNLLLTPTFFKNSVVAYQVK